MKRIHLFEFEDLSWFPDFLRTYSVKEMEDLVNELDNKDQFDWEIGRKKSGPGVNLYLLGTLKN